MRHVETCVLMSNAVPRQLRLVRLRALGRAAFASRTTIRFLWRLVHPIQIRHRNRCNPVACRVDPLAESCLRPLFLAFRLLCRLEGSWDVLVHGVDVVNCLVGVVGITFSIPESDPRYDGILPQFG
jgi:hypothetical protein